MVPFKKQSLAGGYVMNDDYDGLKRAVRRPSPLVIGLFAFMSMIYNSASFAQDPPKSGTGSSQTSGNPPLDSGASATEQTTKDQSSPATPPLTEASIPAQSKPDAPTLPKNFDSAKKKFAEKKYADATKQLQQFIKDGYTDTSIHDLLAQSYYNQHIYSKAIKEYEWLSKNARSYTVKGQAASTANVLACYMAGVCPGPCLNPNSPKWKPEPEIGAGLWWKEMRTDGRPHFFSKVHAGDKIMRNNLGNPYVDNNIKCPICRGTGKTKVLKDGAPL